MSLRSFVIAFLCLALGWAGSVNSATAQPIAKPAKADKMVRVTYPVGDLLVQTANPEQQARADILVRVIIETVAPNSWKEAGGTGAVQFFPFGTTLVVYQRTEVQTEIAALLAELRLHAFGERLPMPREGGAEEQAIPEPKKRSDVKQRAIEQRMRQPINFQLKEMPLTRAMEDLAEIAGVPIVLDLKAIKDARISLDAPITFKASDIDMKTALNLMLRDFDLAFVIENEALLITTKSGGSLFRKTYDVADLINVMTRFDGKAKAESLKDFIQDNVAQKSWESMGGNGTVQYFPKEKILIVNQGGEVHEEIELLLATIRKMYDPYVEIDSRVVLISAKTAKHFRKTLAQQGKSVDVIDGGKSSALVCIDDAQLLELLKLAQTDRVAQVMQAPKTSFLNGQTLKVGVPESISDGMQFEYKPVVSPDRRSVRVAMTFAQWTTADSVRRSTRAAKSFNLPDGRTLAWDFGETTDRHHMFLFVTSRVRVQEEGERVFLGESPPIPR